MPRADTKGVYIFNSYPTVVTVKSIHGDEPGGNQRSKFGEDKSLNDGKRPKYRPKENGTGAGTFPIPSSPMDLQKREIEYRRQMKQLSRARKILSTPPPVLGREHKPVQTELYLEELATVSVVESDAWIQTDMFLDRPPEPRFVRSKTGIDKATQVERDDLFDFYIEVQPILEVLVGKTVEQALLEVAEETELERIRERQRIFQELRNADIVEVQRQEEKNRRIREEKGRRTLSVRTVDVDSCKGKIAAKLFAKGYLQDLVPHTYGHLRIGGYFYDPVKHDLENDFMEWLLKETGLCLNTYMLSAVTLETILSQVASERSEQFKELEADIQAGRFAEKAIPGIKHDTSDLAVDDGLDEVMKENNLAQDAYTKMARKQKEVSYYDYIDEFALQEAAAWAAEHLAKDAQELL